MTRATEALDDRTILGILSQVTADLHEQVPGAEASTIACSDDARAAISALLEQQGARSLAPESIFAEDELNAAAHRRVLDLLLADPATREAAREAVASPPADSQKSVELAAASAVILGSLIAWLQTSLEIQILRKDGKVEFSFKLKKGATAGKTLADVARTVGKLMS